MGTCKSLTVIKQNRILRLTTLGDMPSMQLVGYIEFILLVLIGSSCGIICIKAFN
jgi:hypothetical protein